MEKTNYERLKEAYESYLKAEDRYSCILAVAADPNRNELSQAESEMEACNDILVQTVADILIDEMPD